MMETRRFFAWCGCDVQMRIERIDDGDLWGCYVLDRPTKLTFEMPGGQDLIELPRDRWEYFVARYEDVAKHAALLTVENHYPHFKDQLAKVVWINASDETADTWEMGHRAFMRPGVILPGK
jgi:hypothetical protein